MCVLIRDAPVEKFRQILIDDNYFYPMLLLQYILFLNYVKIT